MEPCWLDFGRSKNFDVRCNCRQKSKFSYFVKAAGKRDPKSFKRSPPERPERAQERPKKPQERLRAAQRRLPSGLGGQLGPTLRPKATRFLTSSGMISHPQGAIFVQFVFSGKRLQNDPCLQGDCLADKPPPNRPTHWKLLLPRPASRPFPLNCQISTATDRSLTDRWIDG